MKKSDRAKLVAQRVHAGQQYDIYPYMYHIQKVVDVATTLGYNDDIISACYLHDSIEDGDISYNDIKKNFGKEVAEIVYAVTDELGRNRKERKEKTYPKIRANWKATVVKICDRIANIEHSRINNPKLFSMYVDEHKGFVKAIQEFTHPGDVMKAWSLLEKMLGPISNEDTKN